MEAPILFKFVKMDLAQFATLADDPVIEGEPLDVFNRFQFAYNFEEHLVLCKTIIEVSQCAKKRLKAELDCVFKIDSESASVIESQTEAVIPPGVLAQFASLAYGSMRGVVYVKAADTPLNNFILPPNDVGSVFNEPQRFHRIG
ncbi:MAG: hypothetical protein NC043_05255 [Muribaculaceae bacterium]|nr:hypothetical protein [Muribaculaceae bacterium]